MDYKKKYKEALSGIQELYNSMKYMSSTDALHTTMYLEKAFPELKESEDEKIRKEILEYFQQFENEELRGVNISDWIAWLEKQGDSEEINEVSYRMGIKRVLDNPESYGLETQGEQNSNWSEEDEQYLLVCKNALAKYQTTDKWDANIISRWLENKLKSLKGRVQPQNFTITDEELAQAKKDAYNDALDKIEYHSGVPSFDDGWSAAIWYLKKRDILKSQSTWKPSKEQLNALYKVYKTHCIDGSRRRIIFNLLEQLKKL